MSDPDVPSFEEVFDGSLIGRSQVATGPAGLEDVDFAAVFAVAGEAAGAGVAVGERRPRFDGDVGQLPAEACWALQALVAAPHVAVKATKHWAALLKYEEVLRSRLSELGLVLEINLEHGYAFTRQGGDPSPHARTLLAARRLSLAASTLALYLYNQYVALPDDPVVEKSDIHDHMLSYKRDADTNLGRMTDAVEAAIKQLEKASVIRAVPGTSRYLVSGVITSILTAERVEALTARYQALADGGVVDGEAVDSGGVFEDEEDGAGDNDGV